MNSNLLMTLLVTISISLTLQIQQEVQGYGDPNVIQGPHSDEDIQSRIAEVRNTSKQLSLQPVDAEHTMEWNNFAFVEIYSNQDWSGSILDTGGDSETIATGEAGGHPVQEGIRPGTLIECKTGGAYSLTFQKQTDQGYIDAVLIKAGKILDEGSTTSDYGVIRLSGIC